MREYGCIIYLTGMPRGWHDINIPGGMLVQMITTAGDLDQYETTATASS